jgi:hypothetical protein
LRKNFPKIRSASAKASADRSGGAGRKRGVGENEFPPRPRLPVRSRKVKEGFPKKFAQELAIKGNFIDFLGRIAKAILFLFFLLN